MIMTQDIVSIDERPNGQHNPPGRAMQDLLHYKTICKCKSADATRADRPGRVHAVVGLPTHLVWVLLLTR
jgi:hypothetical protein